jgi:hypothetical protein
MPYHDSLNLCSGCRFSYFPLEFGGDRGRVELDEVPVVDLLWPRYSLKFTSGKM